MNSKKYYERRNIKFVNYWTKKREHKLKYSLLLTSYFAIPLSLILGISNHGFSELFSFRFLMMFSFTFFFYFLIVYFIEFPLIEKRYQKLLKENQTFDH